MQCTCKKTPPLCARCNSDNAFLTATDEELAAQEQQYATFFSPQMDSDIARYYSRECNRGEELTAVDHEILTGAIHRLEENQS